MPPTIMWFRRDLRLSDNPAHNRVRMIVASFLVKDLHIDWRRGARHFMELLVDGDLANNQHGWQWVAGTGTDPAPFFRIYNPVTQGEKVDPDGDYVRRFVHTTSGGPGTHRRVPPHGGMPAAVDRPGRAGAGGNGHRHRPARSVAAVPAPGAGRRRPHAERNCGRRARTRSA